MESMCRKMGAKLIRINPSHPQIPDDIAAISFPNGWEILSIIKNKIPDIQQEIENENKKFNEDIYDYLTILNYLRK